MFKLETLSSHSNSRLAKARKRSVSSQSQSNQQASRSMSTSPYRGRLGSSPGHSMAYYIESPSTSGRGNHPDYEIDGNIYACENGNGNSGGKSLHQDKDLKNLLIHKNKAFLKKILQEWNLYTLKQYRKRMERKLVKKAERPRTKKQNNSNKDAKHSKSTSEHPKFADIPRGAAQSSQNKGTRST
jgi:hypothetical protein